MELIKTFFILIHAIILVTPAPIAIPLTTTAFSTLRTCAEKKFDGRFSGSEITSFSGTTSFSECKLACFNMPECKEIMISTTNQDCVLLKEGQTPSGIDTDTQTVYSIVECPEYRLFPQKMFDGRPNEWETSAGKEITSYAGFWTLNECLERCLATTDCKEFRIKKGVGALYNGCVLMKEGTHYSGEYTTSFEMYKLVSDAPYRQCPFKLYDGRPKEWQTSDGKELASYDGYMTIDDCQARCMAFPGCREFRIKKNEKVQHKGCVLMKEGTTESGEHTEDYEMYTLNVCPYWSLDLITTLKNGLMAFWLRPQTTAAPQ